MAKAPVLTPQTEDFPRWYQDVINKAELADNGPVRGTMVIRPYGYSLWERMQAEVDARIKAAGAVLVADEEHHGLDVGEAGRDPQALMRRSISACMRSHRP